MDKPSWTYSNVRKYARTFGALGIKGYFINWRILNDRPTKHKPQKKTKVVIKNQC